MSFLIGLLAGIFGGLMGVGGGVVMIPLMVGVLKMGHHKAYGTSLVALVFTGMAGAVTYAMKGSIDVVASLLITVAAVFTARTGARYAHSLTEEKLKRSFGAFMIGIALLLLAKPCLSHFAQPVMGWTKIGVLLMTGIVAGFLSGMLGVGGGSLMVPALVLLAGFSQHTAQGSSLLAMVPASGVGAFTYWRLGNVTVKLLPGLITGILAGTFLGGSFAHMLPETMLRLVFVSMLIIMGLKYFRGPAAREGSR